MSVCPAGKVFGKAPTGSFTFAPSAEKLSLQPIASLELELELELFFLCEGL